MIQILALVLLVWVAVAVTQTVHRERAIFVEFRQTTAIGWLVWLYPLPLALPLFDRAFVKWLLFPIPLDVLFFLPAIAIAIVNLRSFERAATDRVKSAERIVSFTITAGVIAVIGALFFPFLLWVLNQSY